MELEDEIYALVDKVDEFEHNEATTKKYLIEPFLMMLGYNPNNHFEVIPEYTCDVGTKKGEKLDYMIIQNQVPIILIECKNVDVTLNDKHYSQLYRYFSVTQKNTRKIAILTNGLIYQFYSDLEHSNVMDKTPFLEINLEDLADTSLDFIDSLKKDNLDIEAIIEQAYELKYINEIKQHLSDELENPQPDFVKFFASKVYNGKITQRVLDDFEFYVKSAIDVYLDEMMFYDDEDEYDEEVEDYSELENHALHAVMGILNAHYDECIELFIRENKSYSALLLDDNNRKTICRLYFNNSKLYIGLFDENKKETKEQIDNINDIYLFQESICNTYEFYQK